MKKGTIGLMALIFIFIVPYRVSAQLNQVKNVDIDLIGPIEYYLSGTDTVKVYVLPSLVIQYDSLTTRFSGNQVLSNAGLLDIKRLSDIGGPHALDSLATGLRWTPSV